MTGRMVKAYVASAMKDLADQINRRLEQNALMLRIRSLTTGRSMAELAMAGAQPLKVEEVFLIRRGSGELVARWPRAATGSNRDHMLSGTLTAINEFAAEAFKSEGSSLRQIDLDTAQVYLRASPVYLLAAKCEGSPPRAVEQIIDEEFLAALEGNRATMTSTETGAAAQVARDGIVERLARQLEARVAKKQQEIAIPPLAFSPLRAMLWLIAVPLLAWMAWGYWVDYETASVRRIAERVVAESADLTGFPTRIDVEPRGAALTMSGLTPTQASRTGLIDRLHAALPGTQIRDQLGVVPSNLAEAEALIARARGELEAGLQTEAMRASVLRSLDRIAWRTSLAADDLARLEGEIALPGQRPVVARVRGALAEASAETAALRRKVAASDTSRSDLEASASALAALEARLDASAAGLMTLLGEPAAPPSTREAARPGEGVMAGAEAAAAAAERLAVASVAALQTNAVRRAMPPPVAASPRERLKAWTRDNAIFFANNSDYRDPAIAERQLDEAASLILAAGAFVRVVGYTDERGGQSRNTPLSQARADKVLQALLLRGVPREGLVAIGRLNAIDISPASGPTSPNRRVELEVGFANETAP
jgi:outer membrane protein OmpA-like peptidoglycan-associated protein